MNENDQSQKALIAAAVERLQRGELVVMPTETVYGLAADAGNPTAVAGIFALKRRPPSRPLIVHLAGAEQLDEWGRDVPDYARALAERFWPGPLTLVLPRTERVPDAVTGGQDTVALRVPAHPLALALLRAFGGGLAAPSANRYGQISPTMPAHVRAQFGAATPLLLDGGPCRVGIESTIVSCLGSRPAIMRPGSISAAAIERACGVAVAAGAAPESELRVPGQTASHYAPDTASFLVAREDLVEWGERHPGRNGFLGFAPPPFPAVLDLRLEADPDAAARGLYAALHELDAAGVDRIVIERPPLEPSWTAVSDRLSRAVAPKA